MRYIVLHYSVLSNECIDVIGLGGKATHGVNAIKAKRTNFQTLKYAFVNREPKKTWSWIHR
jgi:hypothetical protein